MGDRVYDSVDSVYVAMTKQDNQRIQDTKTNDSKTLFVQWKNMFF